MKQRPIIELSDCICCEICVEVCPAVFSINEAGYIEIADGPVYARSCVDEAARNCPAQCIDWEEAW